MRKKITVIVAIVASFAFISCTKEDGQTGTSGSGDNIVGKTFYTDLYCTLTRDGFVNTQFEFRFSSDNVLYIREGRKIQGTGEMRWNDPIRWSYTIDNAVITVEGDHGNNHYIKVGNIINSETIKWEGQGTLNLDDEKVIWMNEVFKYGLSISTHPQTVTSPYFGWAFEGESAWYCHYLYGSWEFDNVKIIFGRNHILWATVEATSYSQFCYWKIDVEYPSVVVLEKNDNEGFDTIACGIFMNNDQTLQLHYYTNGAPSLDTLFTIKYTRCQL